MSDDIDLGPVPELLEEINNAEAERRLGEMAQERVRTAALLGVLPTWCGEPVSAPSATRFAAEDEAQLDPGSNRTIDHIQRAFLFLGPIQDVKSAVWSIAPDGGCRFEPGRLLSAATAWWGERGMPELIEAIFVIGVMAAQVNLARVNVLQKGIPGGKDHEGN